MTEYDPRIMPRKGTNTGGIRGQMNLVGDQEFCETKENGIHYKML